MAFCFLQKFQLDSKVPKQLESGCSAGSFASQPLGLFTQTPLLGVSVLCSPSPLDSLLNVLCAVFRGNAYPKSCQCVCIRTGYHVQEEKKMGCVCSVQFGFDFNCTCSRVHTCVCVCACARCREKN